MIPRQFLFLIFTFCTLCSKPLHSQILVSGTVYDSSRVYTITGVLVTSTSGNACYTDSLGSYNLNVKESDSIFFSYSNKPTMKFPVALISNYTHFDISLRVHQWQKYKPLKEIFITSSRKEDSINNRQQYANIFNFRKAGIKSSFVPGSPPGFDLDELINIFKFKKNKSTLNFQKRLIEEERSRYVNYRFSSQLIKRLTNLTGEALEKYKIAYRPTYEFATTTDDLEFYNYILTTSKLFRGLHNPSSVTTE